jgi:hypothetical protein
MGIRSLIAFIHMKTILLISILSLQISLVTACAPERPGPRPVSIDIQARDYYNRFLLQATIRNVQLESVDIRIFFTEDLRQYEIGRCVVYGDTHTIYLRRSWWTRNPDEAREQLAFHEMGHCLLGRMTHTDAAKGRIMQSVMATNHFSDEMYVENHEMYMQELFGRAAISPQPFVRIFLQTQPSQKP